jgi:hypothetical protein
MYWLEIIDKMIEANLSNECKHIKVNRLNNGSHCPDCGKLIKISWIIVRCQSCKTLRMSKVKNHSEIVPLNRYCSNCGSTNWFSSRSDDLDNSERSYGIPVKEVMEGENIHNTSKTEIWVEQSEKSEIKHNSNVIKASKRFKN